MTPKEKAEMLLDRCDMVVPHEYQYTYNKYDMFVAKSVIHFCAQTIVDEILYEIDDNFDLGWKKEYYLKVKKEINKQWRKRSKNNLSQK
jgi:hypothetical protein